MVGLAQFSDKAPIHINIGNTVASSAEHPEKTPNQSTT
jgi:hypothetical protein